MIHLNLSATKTRTPLKIKVLREVDKVFRRKGKIKMVIIEKRGWGENKK